MKKFLLSVTLFSAFTFFGCGSAEDKKNEDMPAADTSKGVSVMANDSTHSDLAYICPCGGCPEIRETQPGKCSKCEMDLVEEKKQGH